MKRDVRFSDFFGMTSKFNSRGCVNGDDHEIKRGDQIGWSRMHRVAVCEPCWIRWMDENLEADLVEHNHPDVCRSDIEPGSERDGWFYELSYWER